MLTKKEMKMRSLSFRYSIVFALFLIFLTARMALGAGQSVGENGRLVVLVTWGDLDNTPAQNVIVEVHGYVAGLQSPPVAPVALKPVKDGQYEASLQPGLYDVFVSEGTSIPRCTRFRIEAGVTKTWTLKLEIDHEHLQQ